MDISYMQQQLAPGALNTCRQCGVLGHFTFHCPVPTTAWLPPGALNTCQQCGKLGHFTFRCPMSMPAQHVPALTEEEVGGIVTNHYAQLETQDLPLVEVPGCPELVETPQVPKTSRVQPSAWPQPANCFSQLPVEECKEVEPTPPSLPTLAAILPEALPPTPDAQVPLPLPPKLIELPQGRRSTRSERRLPKKLWVAGDNGLSLTISVELESPHNTAIVSTSAMVDSGATSMGYMDVDYISKIGFPTCRLFTPIPVFNVDGSPNNAGSITHVVDVVL